MSAQHMIDVQDLTKFYGRNPAIQGLNFHAVRGEVLGFLGPNGAGKTTAMRILSGYMPPTSGSASIAGYDVVEDSLEVRRRVGYMPETVPLYPEMTVHEFLAYLGALHRTPDLEDRIDEALEEVQLTDRTHSYIGSLSKGMRQRVGLAQALLHQPEVLILDEPTIGLDPAQIIEVRKMIKDLGRQRTVLLSTHILSEAQQVCDRVLIINKGRIVAGDTPENLQAQLAGADRLLVRAAAETGSLKELLEQQPGIVRVTGTGEEGAVEVDGTPGQDVRPEVARAIVHAGLDLLEMRPVGVSLEDIFLQLTREAEASESNGGER